MQRTQFDDRSCSVAQTLNIIGEWWTPLILRDIFYGIRRFDVLRRHLGISRKSLTNRLDTLVTHGVVERVRYQESPARFEYHLTERGRELFPVIVLLMQWGDKWLAEGEPAVQLVDRMTGELLDAQLVSAETGASITLETVKVQAGSAMHRADWERLQEAIAASNPSRVINGT